MAMRPYRHCHINWIVFVIFSMSLFVFVIGDEVVIDSDNIMEGSGNEIAVSEKETHEEAHEKDLEKKIKDGERVVIKTRTLERDMSNSHSSFEIDYDEEYYIKFVVPENNIEREIARHTFQVDFNSSGATERFPIDVTIRQFRRIASYQLPAVQRNVHGKLVYTSSHRSMDFCAVEEVDSNATITVSLSTTSRTKIAIDIRVLIKGKNADWQTITTSRGISYKTDTAISPAQTRTRFFNPKFNSTSLSTDSIIIEINALDHSRYGCLCTIVIIQQPHCAFEDTVNSAGSGIRLNGDWKTMLNKSAMIIDPEEYPDGFLIVLIAVGSEETCQIHEDQHRCSLLNGNNTSPKKGLEIIISSNGSDNDYAIATLSVIFLYIGIFILTITFSVVEFNYDGNKFDSIIEAGDVYLKRFKENLGIQAKDGFHLADGMRKTSIVTSLTGIVVGTSPKMSDVETHIIENICDKIPDTASIISGGKEHPDMSYIDDGAAAADAKVKTQVVVQDEDAENGNVNIKKEAKKQESCIATIDELDQCEIDPEDLDITDGQTKRRLKKYMYVTDLSMKLHNPNRTKSVYQKSNLFIGVLMLISIYYSLPVLQMVFRFSNEQSSTGNEDLCYYNDLCRKPLGYLRDFNHLFSNLGYFVFGVLFMCLVYLKKWKYEKFLDQNTNVEEDHFGVPQQYGLFFAMGLALAMEGIMSSCYHVCPTNITFQFDTTFMYIMSVMMFLKLYQVRHADVSANAIVVFFGLGVALILETCSIYYSGPVFWFIFCTVYFLFMVVAAVHAYNIGAIRYNYKIVWEVGKLLYLELNKVIRVAKSSGDSSGNSGCCPKIRSRVVGLFVMFIINLLMLLFFAISRTSGSSNYLLAIFMLNTGLYTTYYCIMKHICGEKILKVPMTYTVLGLICFLPAMYYFTQKEKKTEISPAESRSLNENCLLLNFYDGHDIWHFLGAAGVFFAFMFYFTIDEDLKYKKRGAINVF